MADFPSVPFTSMEIRNNTPTIISTSISGLENRTQVATQYWSFTANFNNIEDSQRRQIMGFLMSKRGSFNAFTIALPEPFKDSSGTYLTSPISSITVGAAGATTITATGVSSNALILRAGDFIKFGNHNKVYMVTANATSVGTTVNINIWPAVRTSVVGSSLTHKNVEMYVRCSQDQISFNSDPKLLTTMDLDFVEVIQ